jgi:hypothetical protein
MKHGAKGLIPSSSCLCESKHGEKGINPSSSRLCERNHGNTTREGFPPLIAFLVAVDNHRTRKRVADEGGYNGKG